MSVIKLSMAAFLGLSFAPRSFRKLPAAAQRSFTFASRRGPCLPRAYVSPHQRQRSMAAQSAAQHQQSTAQEFAEPLQQFAKIIPPLDGASHKGQHGKVTVVGGCREYTGAPWFSAFSAMKAGADYGNVFCTEGAATAIKSYAPEIIVHPFLLETRDYPDGISDGERDTLVASIMDDMEPWIAKSSCLVVGPGLGRDPLVAAIIKQVLTVARRDNMPIIVDGDGLAIVNENMDLVRGYDRAILTPNTVEYWRLAAALNIEVVKSGASHKSVRDIAEALDGAIVVAKGVSDIIGCKGHAVLECSEAGAPRRCGGQGDVLTGVMGTYVSWSLSRADKAADADQGCSSDTAAEQKAIMLAAYAACTTLRRAACDAFARKRRSMVASDLIESLQDTVATIESMC